VSRIATIRTEVRDLAPVGAARCRLEPPPPFSGTAQLFSGPVSGMIVRLTD
jgi:hypothetical protein